MSYDAFPDMAAATPATPLTRIAVISTDSLAGHGIARLIERSTASPIDVLETVWAVDRLAHYSLIVLHGSSANPDMHARLAHLQMLPCAPVAVFVVTPDRISGAATPVMTGADVRPADPDVSRALHAALTGIAVGCCAVPACVGQAIPPMPLRPEPANAEPDPLAADLAGLTPRQRDIAALIAEGLPNKHIAERLGIREGTVKVHSTAIFRSLHVQNRTEMVSRLLRSPMPLSGLPTIPNR